MPMVSIKRFLNSGSDDAGSEASLRQAVALLIEKLADCPAVEGDLLAPETFRNQIQAVREGLTPDLPAENVLVLARSAANAQEIYFRHLALALEKHSADFRVIIRMLQESLMKIAGERAAAVDGFSRIGEELQKSTAFKDLNSLKQHLSGCLSGLREEIEREKKASSALIEKLQSELGNLRGPELPASARELDQATELPVQSECLAAIGRAIDSGARYFSVVMVVNRVQRINARFGRDAGDRMLCRFKEHAEKQFFASDRLFRWSGPAIVALIERRENFELIRAQIKRMLDVPVHESLETGGRSVLIPISTAWSLMALNSTAEAAEKQIQTFIASQGDRDFA
ncbi:MAG TPA: GGDEF domain-containing protein [Bryobacteraceae bacterium]|jgi:GGDEF domain-containing protein|nr:GGDEF domain-containing protein [Bryobacteraceae bacterium]